MNGQLPVIGDIDYQAIRRELLVLRERVREITETVDSEDGLITARVDGRGRLEAVFLAGYTPPAHAAREAADRLPGQFTELAAIGQMGVEGYPTVDQNNASRFPR